MQNNKLLPCPFCGGEVAIHTVEAHSHVIAKFMHDYKGGSFIECTKCTCAMSGDSEEEVINAWNTRKPMEWIVEHLEEKSNSIPIQYENNYEQGYANGIDYAIEIVNQVEQQYNDGWILCSSGMLPEEHDSMFAKLKGTDRWKTGMFEKISNEVYVTIEDEKGSKVTAHAHTVDGRWSSDLLRIHKTYRVIAWKPLPEPYRGSDN